MAMAAADPALAALLARSLTPERLSTNVPECHGSLADASVMYQWNTEVTGASWETLAQWRRSFVTSSTVSSGGGASPGGRPGSWLDDPAGELAIQTRREIDLAGGRVRRKGNAVTDGQIFSKLSFGF